MKAQDKQFPPCSVSKLAQLMSVDRHQLQKRVVELNCQPVGKKNGGDLYQLRDLITAFVGGDEKAERVRKLRAESTRLELANAEKQGELVPTEQAGKAIGRVCTLLKSKIANSVIEQEAKNQLQAEILKTASEWAVDDDTFAEIKASYETKAKKR